MQGLENERQQGGAGAPAARARHKRSAARGRHKRPTAHGRHRQPTGRAHLKLTAAALGLTVVVGGAAVARETSDSTAPGRGASAQVPGAQGSASPFVIRPVVRLEAPHAPPPAETTPVAHPARGVPRWLSVPGLGVGAPVFGIDATGGVLRPPGDPHVLGWWRGGARPGAAKGSSLIAGHTVSGGGGVFDDLDRLRQGNRLQVGTAAGVIDYRVTRVRIYRKSTLAQHAARVFSQSVAGRLVLVTCEDWNGTAYLSNVVVFAKAVR